MQSNLVEKKVVFNKKVAKDTFLLCIKSKEIASLAKFGQFLMIRLNRRYDPLLKRPFSISFIERPDRIFILYRVRGRVTKEMSGLKEGDPIFVLGPLGRPFLIEDNKRIILVSGGIGIAPLIWILKEHPERAILISGYKDMDEVIRIEDFLRGDYQYRIAVEGDSPFFKGTSVDLFKSYLEEKGEKGIILSCGPYPMLLEVYNICKEMDIPLYLSLETHMACGIGLCQGCVVETKEGYKRVCKDGPIFYANDLIFRE